MARKPKPFMVFETEEQFKENFDKVYNDGLVAGFRDGSIWTLSYVQELFTDMFKPEAFAAAEKEIRDRQIERWRRNEDFRSLKEQLDYKNFMKDTIKDFAKGS